jgi:hypothetical protein
VNGKAKDGDELIPLKEFAQRLGRNVEATRQRFGGIAVERSGRLYGFYLRANSARTKPMPAAMPAACSGLRRMFKTSLSY